MAEMGSTYQIFCVLPCISRPRPPYSSGGGHVINTGQGPCVDMLWVPSRERLKELVCLFQPSLLCFDDLGDRVDAAAMR